MPGCSPGTCAGRWQHPRASGRIKSPVGPCRVSLAARPLEGGLEFRAELDLDQLRGDLFLAERGAVVEAEDPVAHEADVGADAGDDIVAAGRSDRQRMDRASETD